MANKLSVRSRLRLRRIDDEVYLADGSHVDFRSARRLVILIHGYNNSEAKARKSFAAFRARAGRSVPRHELWEFHWPGDHPGRLTSPLTYPIRVVDSAERSGERLATFLVGLQQVYSVSIVAHSLGCRVTLMAIAEIRKMGGSYPGPRIDHVFLLAAAVPVPQCEGGGMFPVRWGESREVVFYSGRDRALGRAFRRMQKAIGPSEEGPAVGRVGGPPNRWYEAVKTSLGHKEYWRADIVNRRAAECLDLGRDRSLSSSTLAADPIREATDPLDSTQLAENKLKTRLT